MYQCLWMEQFLFKETFHLFYENISLQFTSWKRSTIKEVNDWAPPSIILKSTKSDQTAYFKAKSLVPTHRDASPLTSEWSLRRPFPDWRPYVHFSLCNEARISASTTTRLYLLRYLEERILITYSVLKL